MKRFPSMISVTQNSRGKPVTTIRPLHLALLCEPLPLKLGEWNQLGHSLPNSNTKVGTSKPKGFGRGGDESFQTLLLALLW